MIPSHQVLDKLRDLYSQTEDEIEYSGGKGARTSVVRRDPSGDSGSATSATTTTTTSSGSKARPPAAPQRGSPAQAPAVTATAPAAPAPAPTPVAAAVGSKPSSVAGRGPPR
jgi:hypothetical protein